MMPSRPISASLGMISSGKCEASSHSITCGRISPSANSRIDLRSCCCSEVNEKSKIQLLREYIVSCIAGLSLAYGAAGRPDNSSSKFDNEQCRCAKLAGRLPVERQLFSIVAPADSSNARSRPLTTVGDEHHDGWSTK